jgi:cysteine desulfurase/selenocysteine lyase|tara:strand:- start:139 stop:966 length:828 start_codon:yes stop_codon:yes gene_type:complete
MMAARNGVKIKIIPIDENGDLNLNIYDSLLNSKTKLVFVNHVSNALGTVNPIKEIINKAHNVGAAVLVDGAQASAHFKPDLQELDVDFYTTSAHKLCGPTGIGMLYGKEKWLQKMPPYQGGGEMISEVTFEKTTYAELPHKFEAGTPNISGAIAFGVAIDYLNELGLENIHKYESSLLDYATEKLKSITNLKIYGESENKTSVISFNIEGIHAYDIGTLLDKFGVAVRTGQHCAQPIMDHFGISGTVRASLAFYNTKEEIDILFSSLKRAISMLS